MCDVALASSKEPPAEVVYVAGVAGLFLETKTESDIKRPTT